MEKGLKLEGFCFSCWKPDRKSLRLLACGVNLFALCLRKFSMLITSLDSFFCSFISSAAYVLLSGIYVYDCNSSSAQQLDNLYLAATVDNHGDGRRR